MTEPTKPEALFEGVEWRKDDDSWTCLPGGIEIILRRTDRRGSGMTRARVWAKADVAPIEVEAWVSPDMYMHSWWSNPTIRATGTMGQEFADIEPSVIARLRTQVLKARDELCAVTGTVAVTKEER